MKSGTNPAILMQHGEIVALCTGADFATEHDQGCRPFLNEFTRYANAGYRPQLLGLLKAALSFDELAEHRNAVRYPIDEVLTLIPRKVATFGSVHRINDILVVRVSTDGPFADTEAAAAHYLARTKPIGVHWLHAAWDHKGFCFIYKGPLIEEMTRFANKIADGNAVAAARSLFNQSANSLQTMNIQLIAKDPEFWSASGMVLMDRQCFITHPAFTEGYL